MKKPKGLTTTDYADYKEEHREELLHSAVGAIDPDKMSMTRDQAMTLMGAMKACGFSRSDFATVMARSAYDKGTFSKHWDTVRGSGKNGSCTEGTIYEYAQQCGWKWPTPEREANKIPQKQETPKPAPAQPELVKKWGDGFKLAVIMDTKEYTSKPAKVWEIRNREQSPTPAPDPMTPQEYAKAVTSGRTFSPTVYNKVQTGTKEDGKPIYDYIPVCQQVFVVDIDNDEPATDEAGRPIKGQKRRIDNPLSIDDALQICADNGIKPMFYYETFSSKDHREDPAEPYSKFRLVFVTDKPITVREHGEHGLQLAVNYFVGLFGKAADTSTTDPARLIYGTDEKERAHLQADILDSNKLMQRIYSPKPADTEKQATPEYIKQLQAYYENLIKAWKTDAPVFENGDRQPFIDYITEDEKLDELDALLVKLGVDRETHDNIAHTLNEAAAAETYGTEAPAFSELFMDLKGCEQIQQESTQDTRDPQQEIDAFLTTIQTEQYKPTPTGINAIDEVLDGGIIRQQLVMLTAAPGLGKTTLAQQIIEKMAQNGSPALYFNLEMSKEQMIARSLARMGEDLTATQILQAYKLTDDQRANITKTAQAYKESIAPYVIYNPTYTDEEGKHRETGADLDKILQAMRQAGNKAKKAGEPAPIVCIDYLHLLRSDQDDITGTIKRAVEELKDYAIAYNTIVILISASNRSANKAGKATMDSGRDTSNIEYSGDIMLGLNYKESDKKNGETAEEIADKIKECREQGQEVPEEYTLYSLRIVKSRFTEAYQRAILRFDGRHSKFTEVEKGYRSSRNADGFKYDTNNEAADVFKDLRGSVAR